jgi:hypothetical protein
VRQKITNVKRLAFGSALRLNEGSELRNSCKITHMFELWHSFVVCGR